MAARTPLYDQHQKMGAIFGEYFGWELPERFSSLEGEYQAVRRGVGVIDASYRANMQVVGRDRARYLQSMVTNDISRLGPGAGTYAALLNNRGHVLADMRIYALEDSFMLSLDPHVKDKTLGFLNKYIVADDVRIIDVSERFGTISLQGPESAKLLNKLLEEPLPELQEHHHVCGRIGDVNVRVARSGWVREDGYDVLIARDRLSEVWERIIACGSELDLKPVGMAALNVLRVEAGVPWYGYDFDESNLPLESNLDHAISFTKGCYIGQETVARLHFRGHVNKKLVGLKLAENVPRSGDKVIKDGKEAGWVTSAVYSPALKCPIALAYVRREFFEPGASLEVHTSGGPVRAQVVWLPFYRGSTATGQIC